VAVSKTFGAEQVRGAVEGGVTDLGENRVREAEEKVPLVGRDAARWHLIGHLQTNKINKALDLFDLIHSVDSLELGQRIAQRAERRDVRASVLLQVNVAGKESQFGFEPEALPDVARELSKVPGLSLGGLMCIAPLVEAPETRPFFRQVAQLHATLTDEMRESGHPWDQLSMGMSNDFGVAVEEGATLVRVGRAIFGERTPAPAGPAATRQ
jgi:PLP dependent protein